MLDKPDYDLDRDDPHFLRDLRKSREAVDVVTRWMSGKGYTVIVPPTFERPDAASRDEYRDNGDLQIVQRLEVKHRLGLSFTGIEDFPYPTVLVCTCASYDRARPKPYAYLILNAEMTTALVVDCRTRPQWTRVEKMDQARGRVLTLYECPIELVRVEQINPV